MTTSTPPPEQTLASAEDKAAPKRAGGNPWLEIAGIWKDNPDFDAYMAKIAALRKARDEEER